MSEFDDSIDDGTSGSLDPEGPSAADIERFGSETLVCPACQAEVWDQATICQDCGSVLDTGSNKTLPSWVFVATILVLIAFAMMFIF